MKSDFEIFVGPFDPSLIFLSIYDFYDSQEIMDLEELSEMDLNPIDQGNGLDQDENFAFVHLT